MAIRPSQPANKQEKPIDFRRFLHKLQERAPLHRRTLSFLRPYGEPRGVCFGDFRRGYDDR